MPSDLSALDATATHRGDTRAQLSGLQAHARAERPAEGGPKWGGSGPGAAAAPTGAYKLAKRRSDERLRHRGSTKIVDLHGARSSCGFSHATLLVCAHVR